MLSHARNTIRDCFTSGFRTAVRTLLAEYRIQRRHFVGLRSAKRYAGRTGLNLNLGCGSNVKPRWINIDLLSEGADLCLDLREPLPFDDASCYVVYSEHFFEHLEYPGEAMRLLQECRRVLCARGVFSVGVPDTEPGLVGYAKQDDEPFRIARERWHPKWCDTHMHQLNYHFRQGQEHKYAYDCQTLCKVLSDAGFVNVRRRAWKPELDSKSRKDGTLYVDGEKE